MYTIYFCTAHSARSVHDKGSKMKVLTLICIILAINCISTISVEQCPTTLREILVKVKELEELIKNHLPENENVEQSEEPDQSEERKYHKNIIRLKNCH